MAIPQPPRLPAGERLRRVGVAAWSIIGLLILGYVAVLALLKIRIIFPPLVLALLIIYLLNPVVNRLEDRGVNRTLGSILAYLVVLGSITLLVIVSIPFIAHQIDNFRDDWPHFRTEIVTFVEDTSQSLEDRFGVTFDTTKVSCLFGADEVSLEPPTEERCDEVTEDLRDRLLGSAGQLTAVGLSVLEGLLLFIVAPIIALYLLIDLPQLRRDILNVVPEANRDEVADVGAKLGKAVGGFFRGQLLVALIVGVLSSLGFWIIHLPFWLVIGAIAGFTNLIPLVGPFIGGGLGFLVGTVSGGAGLGLRAALVALIVQQIDNHFISPNVMRRTVQLHPVTVMLGLLAGGALAGFWGVLLAVPGIATSKIVMGHLWQTRVLGVEPSPFANARGAEPPTIVPEPDSDLTALSDADVDLEQDGEVEGDGVSESEDR